MPSIKTEIEQTLENRLKEDGMILRERDYKIITKARQQCLFERLTSVRNGLGVKYRMMFREKAEYMNKNRAEIADEVIQNMDFSVEQITVYYNHDQEWADANTMNIPEAIGQSLEAEFYTSGLALPVFNIMAGKYGDVHITDLNVDALDIIGLDADETCQDNYETCQDNDEMLSLKPIDYIKQRINAIEQRFKGKTLGRNVNAYDIANGVADFVKPFE